MTMLERFTRSLLRKEVDKVPVCSVTQTGTTGLMEMTGTSWPKAFTDPEEMAALAMAGYEIAGLEGVRYPFSSPDIPQAFGCTYSKGTHDSPPHQLDFPCKNPEDVKNVVIPDNLYESPGVAAMIETTDILRKQIDDKGYELPLIAGILGPASFASCVAGVNNYLMWCVKETDALSELIRLGGEVCAEYANVLYDHGADSVVIIDSESGPDLFPPPLFEPMFLPAYQKMTRTMKGLNILHMCGDATAILEPIAESGFLGVSLEEKVHMDYASHVVGNEICLIGNVSPADDLLLRSPAEVKAAAKKCIEDGTRILAPGCGIAPYTPLENIKAFVAARDEYYSEQES
ncbi:Uroporphyrinogen decarboxylase [Methanimicrococcus sp. At1]|uniref:Uroporphyrinogen decarboxylase n=1 Tax=Methanimicrococcus hacksteinii TaxID=3028293 RepID=A0ABU3VQM4_9EURY|nr:methylcobamide:CoM methyltransferase MtaA [Methanimicrococcus sp. At1]MDV0445610.1 Uroporphyrinogen decarboxylase [Methanimicrococcus sp. At1]